MNSLQTIQMATHFHKKKVEPLLRPMLFGLMTPTFPNPMEDESTGPMHTNRFPLAAKLEVTFVIDVSVLRPFHPTINSITTSCLDSRATQETIHGKDTARRKYSTNVFGRMIDFELNTQLMHKPKTDTANSNLNQTTQTHKTPTSVEKNWT